TERDTRRAWMSRGTRSPRAPGRLGDWWRQLNLWWRRFFILTGTGLAIIYGLLIGATVTQALDGDLGKFWAVLVGFGISCWVASCIALSRLLEHDAPIPDQDFAAPASQTIEPE
ncbi:MAG TPA: hypothetical protein VHV31_01045, partial [Nitrolancea sp.]|nr:hypothetical protein [Nitrolancea sp.]